jgi:hypothetical protein
MTFFIFLSGAAIVALVGISFQVWGWSTETNNATLRFVYRAVAAVCGTTIITIVYVAPYSLAPVALLGAAIGIVLMIVGKRTR